MFRHMGRMRNFYWVALVVTAFCSGCPAQESSLEQGEARLEVDVKTLRVCALPSAVEVDSTLPLILDEVAQYWSGHGHAMRYSGPENGCHVIIDVREEALTAQGWGTKEAQTYLWKEAGIEFMPALARFRQSFWVDPTTTIELKAALTAHEIGHVVGFGHDAEPTGKLMSPIVTEDVAQELFGGKFAE